MTKKTIQLGTLSAVNIGITFLFQWYVLTQLGPGIETDALFASMTLPQVILTVISGSLMHVLVPLFAGENENRLRHDAWGFLFLVSGLFGLIATLLYLSAPWWVPLSLPGFDEAGKGLTVDLTRIQLIGMVFSAFNGVQLATYHARQKFLAAESALIFASIFSLLLLIWALPKFGVISVAWISTLRIAVQTLLLAPGVGCPALPDLNSVAIKQAWQRIKPLILGATYYKTDPLVDRFLLSTAGSGSLSLYYLAQQIYGAACQVLNSAIAAPLASQLSIIHKAGDLHGFRRAFHLKLMLVGVISLASLFFLGLFGQVILDLLVGHGRMSSVDIEKLWWIMLWLGGVMVGGAAGQICACSFYACGDTKTPTIMSILTYTIYIPVKVAAFYLWGVMGLAIVTSIYSMTNLLLQVYLLEKKRVL